MVESLTSDVELETVLTLIQILALALPAIAIFFQISLSVLESGERGYLELYFLSRVMKLCIIFCVLSALTIFSILLLMVDNPLIRMAMAFLFCSLLLLVPVAYFTSTHAKRQYSDHIYSDFIDNFESEKQELQDIQSEVSRIDQRSGQLDDDEVIAELKSIDLLSEDAISDIESSTDNNDVLQTLQTTIDSHLEQIDENIQETRSLLPDSDVSSDSGLRKLREQPLESIKDEWIVILAVLSTIAAFYAIIEYNLSSGASTTIFLVILTLFMVLSLRTM